MEILNCCHTENVDGDWVFSIHGRIADDKIKERQLETNQIKMNFSSK